MLEAHGISTVCLSINRDISLRIGAPRSVHLRFPHGAALGEPGQRNQQRTILRDMLWALQRLERPGSMVEPGYRWRRSRYAEVTDESFGQPPASIGSVVSRD